MQRNNQEILNMATRSRISRLKGRDRDTIEKENIRKRTKQAGGEDIYAKDLIYGQIPNSNMKIDETDRFNRDFNKNEYIEREQKYNDLEIKRQKKTLNVLNRKQKIWNQTEQEFQKDKMKKALKQKNIYENPLVTNLGFDLVNLNYKNTCQGILNLS